jgi:cysteine desulfurase / selenocysteine lyase
MTTANLPAIDVDRIRQDFPILHTKVLSGAPLVFLDNAASTQRPVSVLKAMDDIYRTAYANVHRGIHTLSEAATAHYEAARQTVASFIHARETQEVIFTAGTTAAINLIARSWGDAMVKAGDHVLLTMMEHHANIVPWHQLAARSGAKVHFAPLTSDGQIDLVATEQMLLTLRPKLFALTACSNVLGTMNPVESLVASAKANAATVLVDAAQWAPHTRLDVQQWNADFVIFSGHKLCGPTGIGVLWAPRSILEAMPPFLGGGGMINSVTVDGFSCAEIPEKFEAGTPPIVEAIGLAAAIDYLQAIGMDSIHAHEQQLLQRAQGRLASLEGIRILGPSPELKGGILSFVIDKVHAHDVAQSLDHYGIAVRAGHHCTMPLHHQLGVNASARASFYLYNTYEEVDQFIDAVVETQKRFTQRRRR